MRDHKAKGNAIVRAELSPALQKHLDEIKKIAGTDMTTSEVIRRAVILYSTILKRQKEGHRIYSKQDEGSNIMELIII